MVQQKELEGRYQNALERKKMMHSSLSDKPLKRDDADQDYNTATIDLRGRMNVLGRGLQQNPLTKENVKKMQSDRFVPWQSICTLCRCQIVYILLLVFIAVIILDVH